MLSVTADTNIYISALNFGGNPRKILELAEEGGIRLAMSDAIIAEICKVLRGDTFQWPEAEIEKTLRQIRRATDYVEPTRTVDLIKTDPPDNRILECAAEAKSDYIVTGDDHLLRLDKFEGIPILKAADFLKVAR